MKITLLTCMLVVMALIANAQIQVEEAPQKTASTTSSSVAVFDSTHNSSPVGRKKNTYIGKEIFFLDNRGDFFRDSLAKESSNINPILKYYIILDKIYVPGRTYFDTRRMDFVTIESRNLYKLKERGTENIVYYDPELNNSLMPYKDAFSLYDVIWVSYYNYLKTDYIGRKYALTHSKAIIQSPLNGVAYKYNDIWTVSDVKVIKNNGSYVLRLILKNNSGNEITLSPKSELLVEKKTYDEYIKQYGSAMVKAAFEGDLKVGMPRSLVFHVAKHYIYDDFSNYSEAKTSKGEEWTIRNRSKTRYINFNTAGKVISWREEDTQTLRMTGKASVTTR